MQSQGSDGQLFSLTLTFWLLQGEKLSSTLIFAVLQVAAGLLLGIHLPADLAQLVIFLPNSRYPSLTR